jgi:hypothetical protein
MSQLHFDLSGLLSILKEQRPTIDIPEPTQVSSLTQATEPPARPKRCCMEGCKKKLALTDFPCKCGKIHCTQHRASELHNCTYDYKAVGKEQLAKAMPNVTAKKVDVI